MTYTSSSLNEFKEEYERIKERIQESELQQIIQNINKEGSGYTPLEDFINNGKVGKYKINKTLGVGSFSRVHLGVSDSFPVAIKIISKYSDVTSKEAYYKKEERVLREILISSLTSHPNIVRLLDFMYNEYFYFMIFESVEGTQLLDLITKRGALVEKKARKYFNQILLAVNYLHDNSIVHRDLKIENILIDEKDNIKIIDFGLSNFYDKKELLNTFCGSLYFAAPELLTGTEYCGPEVDIWALGVILFVLVCGKVPFDDKDLKTLHKKIKTAKLHFNKDLSKSLINLLERIIVNNPKQRMSMKEILKDNWISKGKKVVQEINKTDLIYEINNNYVNILWGIIKYQFPNFKKEIIQYSKICNEEKNEERFFWTFGPSISLYILLKDNFIIDSSEIPLYSTNKEENMSKFVKFLFNENSNYFNKRKCSTHSNLRKKVLLFFNKENIFYETKEKKYICKMNLNNSLVYFNISLFCNKKIGKHFLTIKKQRGDEKSFKEIVNFIKEVLID